VDGAGDGDGSHDDHEEHEEGADTELVEVVDVDAGGDPCGHDGRVDEPGDTGSSEEGPADEQRPACSFLGDALGQLPVQALVADQRADDGTRSGEDRRGAEPEGGAWTQPRASPVPGRSP
jgi:hypothetical protein